MHIDAIYLFGKMRLDTIYLFGVMRLDAMYLSGVNTAGLSQKQVLGRPSIMPFGFLKAFHENKKNIKAAKSSS